MNRHVQASLKIFSEDDQAGAVIPGGWSVVGLIDGLWQVAATAPGVTIVLGAAPPPGGGPVSLLVADIDEDADLNDLVRATQGLCARIAEKTDPLGGFVIGADPRIAKIDMNKTDIVLALLESAEVVRPKRR